VSTAEVPNVRLTPAMAQSLRSICTTGLWIYPQPDHVRPIQDTLVQLGLLQHRMIFDNGRDRDYLVPTEAGRAYARALDKRKVN
jgi:hypothetical protein